jgi:hypothetical protein
MGDGTDGDAVRDDGRARALRNHDRRIRLDV